MRYLPLSVIVSLFICSFAFAEGAKKEEKDNPYKDITWKRGPGKAPLGKVATFDVPKDMIFADQPNTIKFMKALGNPTDGEEEVGSVLRKEWGEGFAIFEFSNIGYVDDSEKDKLDPDGILEAIKTGTEEGNEARKAAGSGEIHVVGWQEKPHYDKATNSLQWSILAKDEEGNEVLNHQMRVLGRTGVMKITLVGEPKEMPLMVNDFKTLIKGFNFNPGSKYAEYKAGDKIAGYGLTALVAGGTAAAVVKSGVIQKFAKAIFVAVCGVFAAAFKLVRGFRRKKEATLEPAKKAA
jgi:uncharacterized membrane-anchored protein